MTVYFDRADLIGALSQDSQARVSNDPLRKWPVGTTDGLTGTYTTPFLEAATLKVYLDDVEQLAGWTMSRATGTDGEDRVVFSSIPAAGKRLAVAADKTAINLEVIDKVAVDVSAQMDGYLIAYLPITDATRLAVLRDKGVVLAVVRLRGRRGASIADGVFDEWKEAMKWLRDVSKGDVPFDDPTTSSSTLGRVIVGGEEPAFTPYDGDVDYSTLSTTTEEW